MLIFDTITNTNQG